MFYLYRPFLSQLFHRSRTIIRRLVAWRYWWILNNSDLRLNRFLPSVVIRVRSEYFSGPSRPWIPQLSHLSGLSICLVPYSMNPTNPWVLCEEWSVLSLLENWSSHLYPCLFNVFKPITGDAGWGRSQVSETRIICPGNIWQLLSLSSQQCYIMAHDCGWKNCLYTGKKGEQIFFLFCQFLEKWDKFIRKWIR